MTNDKTREPNPVGLSSSRKAIDELDREFIRLLAERMRIVREIGDFKRQNPEAPLRDEGRERNLFEAWSAEATSHGLSGYFVGRVLREILNYSRRHQERVLVDRGQKPSSKAVRIAYQGVPGCYSDLTITKVFSTRDAARVERTGFRSFGEVIDALEADEVDYALLPIENTIAGSINEVYDLIARRAIRIVGEEVWPVEHCLVGLPHSSLDDVRTIRSHPVALQQCQAFLDGLVGCVTESYHDTAGAAQAVASENDTSIAAIASEEAAQHYGLRVLRHGISDQSTNLTRFLLIGKKPEPFDPRQPSKTSLLFSVNHQHGALLRCLQVFDQQDINLTKLESRPQVNAPWEYLFYVDIEGHVDDPAIEKAMGVLRTHTNHLKVLGSYPCRTSEQEVAMRAVLDTIVAEPTTSEPAVVASNGHSPALIPDSAVKKSAVKPDSALKHCSLGSEGRKPVRVSGVEIGGERFVLIAGPCAVESHKQIMEAAEMVKQRGARLMRGGAFKPRSSPYSFQGLGFEGLDLLVEAGRAYEMPVVTEILQAEDVGRVAEKADMLQVGARNMQNFPLLRELGKIDRPILLKRGMSATIKELLMAAEYIMAGGNNRVVLCERGIRTFETSTRSTLDVSAVPVLKQRTHLPVIVDPSHAAGVRDLVVPLALAAVAAGADGLIVEAHPNPAEALCDKDQALTERELDELLPGIKAIVASQRRLF